MRTCGTRLSDSKASRTRRRTFRAGAPGPRSEAGRAPASQLWSRHGQEAVSKDAGVGWCFHLCEPRSREQNHGDPPPPATSLMTRATSSLTQMVVCKGWETRGPVGGAAVGVQLETRHVLFCKLPTSEPPQRALDSSCPCPRGQCSHCG